MTRFPPLLVRFVAITGVVLCGCDAAPPTTPRVATPAEIEALGASLRAVSSEPDAFRRAHQLATLLPGIPAGTGPELKHALQRGAKMGMSPAEFDLLVRAWAAQQPEEATRWSLAISNSRTGVTFIQLAVEAWARKDPNEAVAQLTRAAQSGIREVAQAVQAGLVRGWFQMDRQKAREYVDGLSGIEHQRAMLAYVLALQEADGSDALMRWAEATPDEQERYKRALYREVAMGLAWADPPAAERWCDAHCEGPFGKSLRTIIVRVRLHNGEDGARILEWVGRTPESKSQLHALRVGYQLWGLKQPEKALAWMEGKLAAGPEPWVEKLHGAYARLLAVKSPAEGMRWAEKIPSEKARRTIMVRIARRWMRVDPAAAESWLEQSPLTEEERADARDLSKPDFLPGRAQEASPGTAGELATPSG